MIEAKTFTFQYDGREDRLKMLINYASPTDRLELFITRAFLLRLIPVIEELFIKKRVEHKQPAAPNPGASSKPLSKNETATDRATLKLLETPSALLLDKLDFNLHENPSVISLTFYSNGESVARSQMPMKAFSQIVKVMMSAVPHIQWGVSPQILDV